MVGNARLAALKRWQERAARIDRGDPEDRAQRNEAAAGLSELERAAVVETSIQQAIRQGAFDDLPGSGKPIEGLDRVHDPDWWIRDKIRRERISGLGPPALMLRVENTRLEEKLDALTREADVRDTLEDFNDRVLRARMQLEGGPPVVTPTRDVDVEVAAWRRRRDERRAAERERRETERRADETRRKTRRIPWFRR